MIYLYLLKTETHGSVIQYLRSMDPFSRLVGIADIVPVVLVDTSVD